jgi:hypothetical protein
MSFFAVGSGLAVAAGATAGGLVATGAGMAASYAGSKLVNKVASGSSSGSAGSLPYNQLDVNQIIADARTTAADNYKKSLELEAQNNPAQTAFRNAATQAALTASFNPPGQTPYTSSDLTKSLLDESADSILQELRMGGKLAGRVSPDRSPAAVLSPRTSARPALPCKMRVSRRRFRPADCSTSSDSIEHNLNSNKSGRPARTLSNLRHLQTRCRSPSPA